jgi:adenosylcobinamide-phosphate synthase
MWRLEPAQVVLAIALDLVLGDPRDWPHVTRLAGKLSSSCERLVTGFAGRTILSGAFFWGVVCCSMLARYFASRAAIAMISPRLAWVFDIAVIYQTLAAADLHRHVRSVFKPLRAGDLGAARAHLAMIVGRDTANLDESEISRATMESLAESTNDGFVAPLFWCIVAGAPGALLYRTANTLDSMVGHRDERYEKFGKVSARADDALSWVPARLCAAASEAFRSFRDWRRIRWEALAHASPNAGWSEAALAFALGVRLGGDNFYDGLRVRGPIFHAAGRAACAGDIPASLRWFWRVVALCSVFFLVASVALHRILP